MGHPAEIQPALDQSLVSIIAVDVPQQRKGSVFSVPSGVKLTPNLLLRRHEY